MTTIPDWSVVGPRLMEALERIRSIPTRTKIPCPLDELAKSAAINLNLARQIARSAIAAAKGEGEVG